MNLILAFLRPHMRQPFVCMLVLKDMFGGDFVLLIWEIRELSKALIFAKKN